MPFNKLGLMRRPRTEEKPTDAALWRAIRLIQSHQAAQASTLSTVLTELAAVNIGVRRALGDKYRPVPRSTAFLCGETHPTFGRCMLGEAHLGNHAAASGHQWADGKVIP